MAGQFKVSEFLSSQGLKLTGRDGDALLVETTDGKPGKFVPQEFLKAQGVDPTGLEIEINSVDNPIPDSPVGLFDRAKLSLGNSRGGMEYLKSKYDNVAYNPDQGLLVKDKGAWHKVDPDMFDDPWSLSEAIADTAEFVGGSALPMAGATAAAIAAAPSGPGSIAAAGAGGAAGKAVTSSVLGRLVGTYKPESAQDELEDIGLEGLFAAGGQAIAVGAKPTWEMLKGAMKNIGRWGSEASKDALAATLGRTTAAGSEATRYMFDNVDDVARTIKTLKPMSQGTDDLINQAASKQVEAATSWLERADKALPQKYGQMLDRLSQSADDAGLKVHVRPMIEDSLQEFERQGFGKVVEGRLVQLSEEDIASLVANGTKVPEGINGEVFQEVRQIFDTLKKFSGIGEVSGGKAARVLTEINKKVNSSFDDTLSPIAKRAKAMAMASVKTRVGSSFEKAGLESQWAGMNQLYQRYGDAVGTARKLLASDGGPERFYQSLFSGAGKKATMKGEADLLEELAGEAGTAARRHITNLEAAKRFAPILPKFGLSQAAATGAGSMGVITGAVSAPVAMGVASTFSPRTMLHATRGYQAMSNSSSKYALTLVQALKTLPPASLKKAMADPNMIRAATQETLKAMYGEDENVKNILQQSGVMP